MLTPLDIGFLVVLMFIIKYIINSILQVINMTIYIFYPLLVYYYRDDIETYLITIKGVLIEYYNDLKKTQ